MCNYIKSVLSLLFIFSLFLSSAHAADFKIGSVDLQKVLSSSNAGKSAQKEFENDRKKLQEKINDKKSDWDKSNQGYQKQKDSLNEKARAEKEEQLLGQEKELKRTFQDAEESLRRRNAQLVSTMMEKVKKIVDEYGKSAGYTVILERNGQSVLFLDSSIDITEIIVKKLDEATK